MDKVIVSGLLLIASVAAAVITISIITPALGSDNESIVKSNKVASTLTSTGFDGITAVVDGGDGLNISAWFKNVGSVDIDPISEIDIFLLTGNRLSGRYIPYSDAPISTDRWETVLPGNSSVWARGDTLQIRLTLDSSNPITIGRYKLSLTTPIGVSGDVSLEYGFIPTPTLIPTPTPTPTPAPTSTPMPSPGTFPINWVYAGRSTSWSEVNLNGTGGNDVTVSPGSTVSVYVRMTYTDSSGYCPGCVVQFYVRMNGVFTNCLSSGSTYGGGSNTRSFDFIAPSVPGEYYLQPKGGLDYSCNSSTSVSETLGPSTLGKVKVVAGPGISIN